MRTPAWIPTFRAFSCQTKFSGEHESYSLDIMTSVRVLSDGNFSNSVKSSAERGSWMVIGNVTTASVNTLQLLMSAAKAEIGNCSVCLPGKLLTVSRPKETITCDVASTWYYSSPSRTLATTLLTTSHGWWDATEIGLILSPSPSPSPLLYPSSPPFPLPLPITHSLSWTLFIKCTTRLLCYFLVSASTW